MGKAQTAWRLAKLEGDSDGMAVAYHWLYHGSLVRPCNEPQCECCGNENKRVVQAHMLMGLVADYLEP